MPTAELPAGSTTRAPELADAEAIVDLATAYTMAAIGVADYTLDDVNDELTAPGFDLARDAWLVADEAARLTGYAWVQGKDDSDQVDIEVIATDPAVTGWLVQQCVRRAAEMGRENGHPQMTIDQGVYRADEQLRAALRAQGFEPATTFHRMRIDHTAPVAAPETPPGVVLLECGETPANRKLAYEVKQASFADHFGFAPSSYDYWYSSHERRSTFDWSQLWVAELDGAAVGVLDCNDQYADEENCGYVNDLGVLAAARGRGIAKYLLKHAFAVDSAAGRIGTILHVDSNNTTPALGLYTSVGMRPVLVIDVWRHVVRL